METIVVYNAGYDAAKEGCARTPPEFIWYPIISKYQPYHKVEAFLNKWQKKVWLEGFDAYYSKNKKG